MQAKLQGGLPFVTPPDGHIFWAKNGSTISFWAAGQHGMGQGYKESRILSILFEEDPTLMQEGAFSYTHASPGSAKSVVDEAHISVFSDTNPVTSSYNPIARRYR